MTSIKKAVIPAAGFGTRVLPLTKSIPKEMIPIVDKPSIQYIVEEAVNSGITDILIIVNRGKTTVEDHFDRSPELEHKLIETGKTEMYKQLVHISEMANISFIRQQQALGLGHAIMLAENFVGNEPFAVLYGDDVIFSETPVCKQLCSAYEKYNKGIVGIKEVSEEEVLRYSTLAVSPIGSRTYEISDMIEKPGHEEIISDYSILGRCILPPEIFSILHNTKAGIGGEIQLTDAMKTLANTKGMIGIDFEGKRFDMGNKLGILKANVEAGLSNKEIGPEFREYLKSLTTTI